ncbi:MAG: hybrid sensor histidine kinase/response regulator, partial [Magnetococcales bacterium]|nr:hybrid sensor histidine kinase/response regulator [Magnetococcales bacterium]
MSSQTSSRILIVDDDPINVDILEEMLEETNFIWASVSSGNDALERIPTFRPDLILLDIMMPGMDGYEVCRAVRSDPSSQFIKIILVTGKGLISERLTGYEAGADDYLVKPFNTQELLAKINVFLQLGRMEEIDTLRSDLLALISHETRTPLNGILGPLEILRMEPHLSEEGMSYIDMIERCGKQLLTFVQKTSLLCDLRRGDPLAPRSDTLRTHLDQIREELSEKIEEKGITMTLEVPKTITIQAEWNLLDMLLKTVMGNAVRFSPESEMVTLS